MNTIDKNKKEKKLLGLFKPVDNSNISNCYMSFVYKGNRYKMMAMPKQ